MPQLDARRLYEDGSIMFASDIDAFLDDIETLFNSTKLNDDNIQDAGITASTKLVDGTITAGKLGASAVTTAKIQDDAVTADKIADGAIDLPAKLASNVVTTVKILDDNVTAAKIADGAIDDAAKLASNVVTTAKILDANVTAAKIASGTITGTQVSSNIALPGAGVTVDGRNVVVSSYQSAMVPISFPSVTAAGFSNSGNGWTATGDGNAGTVTVTFSNAFAVSPVLIKSDDFPGAGSLSSISASSFVYTGAGGGQIEAFKVLAAGAR